jgi:molybdenum cofactor cytidylyltransferase
VVVVLGSNADEHKKTIAHLPVEIITHDAWEKGMGSSVKAGLKYVTTARPDTKAIVIMVCDQPWLTEMHLSALRDAFHHSSAHMVASRYGNTLGVPALFDQTLFSELLNIKDTQGAKVVIENYRSDVLAIDWAAGLIDIDTPEDLKSLSGRKT